MKNFLKRSFSHKNLPLLWIGQFVFLFGCSHTSNTWELEAIADAPYSRLSFVSNSFPKIAVEFLPIQKDIACFITFLESQIVPSSGKKTTIAFHIDQHAYKKTAMLREGNQRLVLEKEEANLLIQSLLEGKTVAIEINGYHISILPDHFSESFEKLTHKKTSWEISSLFRPL